MPPTSIPLELLNLFIEHLAQQPSESSIPGLLSCSLVNSAFRDICQKYIFASIQLWPEKPNHPSEDRVPSHTASLVIRSLLENPGLGAYVRRLDYQVGAFPRDDDDGLDSVLRVLEMLTRIEDLKLGIRSGTPGTAMRTFPAYSECSRWTHAIRSLVQRPTLEILRLQSIGDFPLDALSTSIRSLCLQRASCDYMAAEVNREAITTTVTRPMTNLETLICDDTESLAKVDESLRAGGLALSSMRNLHVAARYRIEAKWIHLFSQAHALQNLHISVSRRNHDGAVEDGIKADGFSKPPWVHMAQSTLHKLSHLKVTIRSSIFGNPTPILRPYTGLLSDSFLLLVGLERLEINIFLAGIPRIRPQNFSASEWRQLPALLGKESSLPKLRRLSVLVRAELFDYDEEHAQILASEMAERTFSWADFHSLLDLRPELDLSFVVEVSMGLQGTVLQRRPYITPRVSNHA